MVSSLPVKFRLYLLPPICVLHAIPICLAFVLSLQVHDRPTCTICETAVLYKFFRNSKCNNHNNKQWLFNHERRQPTGIQPAEIPVSLLEECLHVASIQMAQVKML